MTILKIGKNRIKDLRNDDGTFKKGTEIGQMPKKGFNLHDLNKLVLDFEKSLENKKGSLLKHYIKRLFENDRLLAKYMDKNIATKSLHELTGESGEPINIVLKEIIYGKEAKKGKHEKPKTLDK